jgi:hypothetical protein
MPHRKLITLLMLLCLCAPAPPARNTAHVTIAPVQFIVCRLRPHPPARPPAAATVHLALARTGAAPARITAASPNGSLEGR